MAKYKILIAGLCLTIVGLTIYIINLKEVNNLALESSFAKKELCANNRQNAQKQLDENYSMATPFFYDIFYSSKTDSCIYTYGLVLYGTSPNEVGSFIIMDYFNGQKIESFKYDNSSGDEKQYSYTIRPHFDKAVERYRD